MLTAKEVAYAVTKALDSKKGQDIKLLKIDKVSSLADYFLICTGTSNTHSPNNDSATSTATAIDSTPLKEQAQ